MRSGIHADSSRKSPLPTYTPRQAATLIAAAARLQHRVPATDLHQLLSIAVSKGRTAQPQGQQSSAEQQSSVEQKQQGQSSVELKKQGQSSVKQQHSQQQLNVVQVAAVARAVAKAARWSVGHRALLARESVSATYFCDAYCMSRVPPAVLQVAFQIHTLSHTTQANFHSQTQTHTITRRHTCGAQHSSTPCTLCSHLTTPQPAPTAALAQAAATHTAEVIAMQPPHQPTHPHIPHHALLTTLPLSFPLSYGHS